MSPPRCDLCEAARMTSWYYEDEICWVADCEICAVPMVVWRLHGTDPPEAASVHMMSVLDRVASERFPKVAYRIDPVMRQVPDHFHAHARDEGWWYRRPALEQHAPERGPARPRAYAATRDATSMDTDKLEWSQIAKKLAASRNYWLATTGRNGAPHATPVWGVVVDDVLHLYTERRTAKARNLAADPRLVVHLESAEDVVIVHGVAEDLGAPSMVPDVVSALDAKYDQPGDEGYIPSGEPAFDVVYAVRPTFAATWILDEFEESQRRWSAQT